MKPDQHPVLKTLTPGEATCDRCIMEFFPNQGDDVCEECGLNPLTSVQAKRDFLGAALGREGGLSLNQLQERQAKLTPS